MFTLSRRWDFADSLAALPEFAKVVLGLILASALFMGIEARAQSMAPDPYSANQGYGSGAANTYYGGNGSTAGSSNSAASGAGATGYGANSSGYGYGSATPPPGVDSELTGMGSAFTPTLIPNLPAQGGGAPLDQILRPPTTGATPAPLYARPGAEPGEFELFGRPPPRPSEFELYVQKALGRPLPRFGASLILKGNRGFATPSTATVPLDYKLNPGDELSIGITGPVEGNLKLTIDSDGRVFIPRIGAINVAGLRYGDLSDALTRRFNELYKQSKISVVIAHLHGITVYVTGYVVSPGAYTVSSLSTLIDAVLEAGGPAAGGSFRNVVLRRDGKVVTKLDLYDLLLNGDRSHDAILQNEDVINIEPTGPEVAITGSVNEAAIFESKDGESLADLVRYAGGPNTLADRSRIVISRLSDLDHGGLETIPFSEAGSTVAQGGTIVRVLTDADLERPREQQFVLASIEGEVVHPGRYYLPPGSTLRDLIEKAGGVTPGAFPYGSILDRDSVRRDQKISFDQAIDQLQLSAAAAPLGESNSISALSGSTSSTAQTRQQSIDAIIGRLKQREPDGRLVLDVPFERPTLPETLLLENNDRLDIPPTPSSVGVFGAVFGAGSFIYQPGRTLASYIEEAGGPQRFADRRAPFVVRADGSVVSALKLHGFDHAAARPGDVIFMPVRTGPGGFERLREIAQVVYQLGIGVATLAILSSTL